MTQSHHYQKCSASLRQIQRVLNDKSIELSISDHQMAELMVKDLKDALKMSNKIDTKNDFNYSEYCNKKLFDNFPKILELSAYKSIIDNALQDPWYSAHSIYDSGFCLYILDAINSLSMNKRKLQKAFNLIEQLILHEEFEVRCVAEVSFIERFVAELKPTKDVEKYLRPASLKVAREIAQQRFDMNPYTWEKED